MATLFNTIERVASEGQVAVVHLDLLWDQSLSSAAWNASEQRSINGPIKISTNYDGFWEINNIDLNSDITPANNIYVVTELVDNESVVHYVTLDTDGSFWLGDVFTTKPVWVV